MAPSKDSNFAFRRAMGASGAGVAGDRFVLAPIALVASLRGWPEIPALPVLEASDEALEQLLRVELDAQLPRDVSRGQDRALGLLGLIPVGFDTRSTTLTILRRTLHGVYLHGREAIALRRELAPGDATRAITHEVVHAFQDRLFGLGNSLNYRAGLGDSVAAMHALAEGEALWVEAELTRLTVDTRGGSTLLGELEQPLEPEVLGFELPHIVRRALGVAYRDGVRFLSFLRGTGNWQLVDAVWRRGLTNTAELLHPERWISADGTFSAPNRWDTPRSDRLRQYLSGADAIFEDSIGEQGLRLMLEEANSSEFAADAAAQWRADRLWWLRVAEGERLVWILRMVSSVEAERVGKALSHLFLGTLGPASTCTHLHGRTLAVVTHRQDILVAASGKSDTLADAGPQGGCSSLREWMRPVSHILWSTN